MRSINAHKGCVERTDSCVGVVQRNTSGPEVFDCEEKLGAGLCHQGKVLGGHVLPSGGGRAVSGVVNGEFSTGAEGGTQAYTLSPM